MKVNEIFYSIEGEGIRAGYPCIFIRLYGCNLNCSYCDTRYSCEGNDYEELSINLILKELRQYKCKRVTITGGEPLIHKDVLDLIAELTRANYQVNIETNGSVELSALDEYPSIKREKVIVTMDYKLPSSGMENCMQTINFPMLRPWDVLKFVVGNENDLKRMKQLLDKYKITSHVFVSPVFGQIEPSDIVYYVISNELTRVRVQLQLHKFIWDPQKRGV